MADNGNTEEYGIIFLPEHVKLRGKIKMLRTELSMLLLERDIFLFDTHIAGTTYIEGIEELAPYLNIGDKLDLYREPDNPYDSKAIVIKNADGVKIGYVPRADNAVFSRLMDAGKLLFGKITDKKMKGDWLKIDIGIYLHE